MAHTFVDDTRMLIVNVHKEPQACLAERGQRLRWIRNLIDKFAVMAVIGGDFNLSHSDEMRENATGELVGGVADPTATLWERMLSDVVEDSQPEPTRRQTVSGVVTGTARLDRFYVPMRPWDLLDFKPMCSVSGSAIASDFASDQSPVSLRFRRGSRP